MPMVALGAVASAPLTELRRRSRAGFLIALGLRVVLVAALLGVLAGLVEAVLWEPRAADSAPVVEVCPDPPCLPDSLPDPQHLLLVLPPLGYLLAALLGGVALLVSLRSGGRRRLLPVLGPVVVLIAMEVVPHLVNPCLVAGALGDSLPSGCAETVHGIDVHDRWHALHHAVVGGVPAALGYAALLRRRRPELFTSLGESSR